MTDMARRRRLYSDSGKKPPYIPVEAMIRRPEKVDDLELERGGLEARRAVSATPTPSPRARHKRSHPKGRSRVQARPLRPPPSVKPVRRALRRKRRRHLSYPWLSRYMVRPVRRVVEVPPWKTKSGLAGIILMIVFLLGMAHSVLMSRSVMEVSEPSGSVNISGHVVDEKGRAVPYANVELDGRISTRADVNGYFYIENVPVGDHVIRCTARNFNYSIYHVTVTQESRDFIIQLNPDRNLEYDRREEYSESTTTVPYFSVSIAVLSAFCFIGGVLAYRGIDRRIPAVSAALGISTLGLYVGSALSAIALVLLLASAKEFEPPKRCAACGSAILKGISVTCKGCGTMYHHTCADQLGICPSCGSDLMT